jgi:hypothetical protein
MPYSDNEEFMENQQNGAALRFWYIGVEVLFRRPLAVNVKGKVALGFVKEFGYSTETQANAQTRVEEIISADFPGNIKEIRFDWIGEIFDVENEIYADDDLGGDNLLQSPYEEGLWYMSGYGFILGKKPPPHPHTTSRRRKTTF